MVNGDVVMYSCHCSTWEAKERRANSKPPYVLQKNLKANKANLRKNIHVSSWGKLKSKNKLCQYSGTHHSETEMGRLLLVQCQPELQSECPQTAWMQQNKTKPRPKNT